MTAVVAFEQPGKAVLRGSELYWRVMRDLDQKASWCVQDVVKLIPGSNYTTVSAFLRRLLAAGMAVPVGKKDGPGQLPRTFYRLHGPQPERAPRLTAKGEPSQRGRRLQQMWTVMRGPLARDGFTYNDLMLWGSTDDVEICRETAKNYIRHLAKAGYLIEARPTAFNEANIWRLKPSMNTGPRHPLVLLARVVLDQNRMKSMAPIEAEEVAL